MAAQPLSSNTIPSTLTGGQTSLFSTIPSQLNRYIEFAYGICTNSSQVAATFTLWG